jgi:hypothetical protein
VPPVFTGVVEMGLNRRKLLRINGFATSTHCQADATPRQGIQVRIPVSQLVSLFRSKAYENGHFYFGNTSTVTLG